MTSINQDFTTYAGNSYSKVFTATDEDGLPFDISGATQIIWQASRDATSAPVLQKTLGAGITVVTPASSHLGEFSLQLLPGDTQNLSGFYMHQAIVSLPDGTVTTVILGRFQVGRVPAASYSGDPANSPRDAVRFWMQDTDPENPFLKDPEIDLLLSIYPNPIRAAAAGARQIAVRYAAKADKAVGDFRISYGQISKNYLAIADRLDMEGATMGVTPYSGGISHTDRKNVSSNPDRVKPPFTRDQFDNRSSGNLTTDGPWDDCSGPGPS